MSWVRRLKAELVEKTVIGLSDRYNKNLVEAALVNNECLYLKLRRNDGLVMCHPHTAKPIYYSQRYRDNFPVPQVGYMWYSVDPVEPLRMVVLQADGSWYIFL